MSQGVGCCQKLVKVTTLVIVEAYIDKRSPAYFRRINESSLIETQVHLAKIVKLLPIGL